MKFDARLAPISDFGYPHINIANACLNFSLIGITLQDNSFFYLDLLIGKSGEKFFDLKFQCFGKNFTSSISDQIGKRIIYLLTRKNRANSIHGASPPNGLDGWVLVRFQPRIRHLLPIIQTPNSGITQVGTV